MNRQFCTQDFWNWTQLWLSSPPHISDCLQLTLICVPCGLFCISCILFFLTCSSRRSYPITHVPFCGLHLVKILVHVLLAALPTVAVISKSMMTEDHLVDYIYILSAVLQTLSVVFSMILLDVRRRMKRPACPILFTFWFTLSLSWLPRLYDLCSAVHKVGSIEDVVQICVGVISNVLVVITFILVTHTGHSPTRSLVTTQDPCPEVGATVASKLTYWWLNGFIYQAYKRRITREDVFNLRHEDSVAYNYNRFQRAWDRAQAAITSRPLDQCVNGDDSVTERATRLKAAVKRGVEPGPATMNKSSKSAVQHVSLLGVIVRVYGWQVVVICLFHVLYDLLYYAQPFLLSELLNFISTPDAQMWHGYFLATFLLVLGLFSTICIHRCYYLANVVSLRVRSLLVAAIYRKSLRLSNESRGKYRTGEIVNLMSLDSQMIANIMQVCWFASTFFVQLIIGLALLWQQLGASVFVGIGILIMLMPLNAYMMKYTQMYQTKKMEWKDSRLQLLNEMLSGIKILKLYGWEPAFAAKLSRLREKEVYYLGRASYMWAGVSVIWAMASYLVILSTFLVYVHSGETAGPSVLTPARIFVCLSLFNMIQFPMTLFPWRVSAAIMAMVSMRRINDFLCQDDLDCSYINFTASRTAERALTISHGRFAWKKDGAVTLQDVDVCVSRGSLVAIVGKVGTGKSSLLSACMGEMVRLAGAVEIEGDLAYVPQVAWIRNQSLRENVLFGRPMESAWYQRVITACALQPDIDLLPAGDKTKIGGSGMTLSGGQRQRVCLARAVYQRSDIYLLDDPLSSVDAHVGKHLFEQVIGPRGLLNEKTRIFITHGFQWLPFVDHILVLNEEGHIAERGTYQELLKSSGQFMELFLSLSQQTSRGKVENSATTCLVTGDTLQEDKDLLDSDIDKAGEQREQSRATDIRHRFPSRDSGGTMDQSQSHVPHSLTEKSNLEDMLLANESTWQNKIFGAQSKASNESEVAGQSRGQSTRSRSHSAGPAHGRQQQTTTGGQRIEEEFAEQETVSWRTYLDYFAARNIFLTLVTVGAYAGCNGFQIWSNVWLQRMADDKTMKNAGDHMQMNQSTETRNEWMDVIRTRTDYYMSSFAAVGIGEIAFVIVYSYIGTISNLRASKVIHSKLLAGILRASMSFFDTTPTGRIVSRFSRDINIVDHSVPEATNETIGCAIAVIASFLVISIRTPLFLTLIAPVVVIYYIVQKFHISTSRQATRLELTTRSPIFTNFSETIAGSTVIRAFQQKQHCIATADNLVDTNARFSFVKWACSSWLGIFLELVGHLIVFATIMIALRDRSTISPAVVGLLVSYALQITNKLNWFVRQATELETNSVSLERIKEYSHEGRGWCCEEWYLHVIRHRLSLPLQQQHPLE